MLNKQRAVGLDHHGIGLRVAVSKGNATIIGRAAQSATLPHGDIENAWQQYLLRH